MSNRTTLTNNNNVCNEDNHIDRQIVCPSHTNSRRQFLNTLGQTSLAGVVTLRAPQLLLAASSVFSISTAAHAASHAVSAIGVKYDPMFIYIEPGDQVNWENMAGHNVETIDSMVPEGQEKVLSELGLNVSVTFDIEGIVIYKCTPHWGTRMGGVIVVGKPTNSEDILDGYLASLETDKANLPAKGLIKKVKKDMQAKGLI